MNFTSIRPGKAAATEGERSQDGCAGLPVRPTRHETPGHILMPTGTPQEMIHYGPNGPLKLGFFMFPARDFDQE
jgi:hypothetical protein